MRKRVYIIIADAITFRKDIEDLEGRSFDDISAFWGDPEVMRIARDIELIPISDFMDDWNDTDDDRKFLNIRETWFGYVFIGNGGGMIVR